MVKRKLFFCGLFFLVCAAVYGKDEQETRRSFTVNPGASIALKNISGNITISSWDGTQVEVVAVKIGNPDHFDRVEISINDRASRLDIKTKYPNRGNSNVSVRYDLKVPRNVEIDIIESISGNIEIAGIDGEVNAKTVSGSVNVSDIMGSCSIKTVSGRIRIHQVQGSVRANSVSGGIVIQSDSPSEKSLTAATVSGNVQFNGRLNPDGMYAINCHSGTITLNLPNNSNFVINASTFSGSIKSDFDIKNLSANKGSRKKFVGTVGSGGSTVELSTFSGKIQIASAGRQASPER